VTTSAPQPIRTRFYVPRIDDTPISAINMTPLIDMMLVLVIMFIVAMPMATHKVPVDLPSDRPAPGVPPPVHRLDIDAGGRTMWDGRPLSGAALNGALTALAADPAEPALILGVDGAARYERVDQILADVRRAGVDRLGFVGNQDFARTLDH
jgi:biopolymer transport protein ExbD